MEQGDPQSDPAGSFWAHRPSGEEIRRTQRALGLGLGVGLSQAVVRHAENLRARREAAASALPKEPKP